MSQASACGENEPIPKNAASSKPGFEGQFLLRTFTEKPNESHQLWLSLKDKKDKFCQNKMSSILFSVTSCSFDVVELVVGKEAGKEMDKGLATHAMQKTLWFSLILSLALSLALTLSPALFLFLWLSLSLSGSFPGTLSFSNPSFSGSLSLSGSGGRGQWIIGHGQ